MGVNRIVNEMDGHIERCPHTRGGEPSMTKESKEQIWRCPHTRGGEPILWAAEAPDIQDVPTHVGVNRRAGECLTGPSRCPHTRGGEPFYCFLLALPAQDVPTHVGVNRNCYFLASTGIEMSPHTWG